MVIVNSGCNGRDPDTRKHQHWEVTPTFAVASSTPSVERQHLTSFHVDRSWEEVDTMDAIRYTTTPRFRPIVVAPPRIRTSSPNQPRP